MADDANAGHAAQGVRFTSAKFRRPALPATLVTRSALHGRLTAGARQRLTIVVGAAGTGKTVLLSSWAAERSPGVTAWLSCDKADANPVRFWAAFIEAPRTIAPGFGSDAAGLLATPGSAPYSVTKHAALAFAEWLSLTHRHRGLTVQAICPMGVRTGMFDGSDPLMEKLLGASAIMPDDVADAVMEAIADGRFLILPHPEVAEMYSGRAAEPDRWLHGMNKVQQHLEDGPA